MKMILHFWVKLKLTLECFHILFMGDASLTTHSWNVSHVAPFYDSWLQQCRWIWAAVMWNGMKGVLKNRWKQFTFQQQPVA